MISYNLHHVLSKMWMALKRYHATWTVDVSSLASHFPIFTEDSRTDSIGSFILFIYLFFFSLCLFIYLLKLGNCSKLYVWIFGKIFEFSRKYLDFLKNIGFMINF